MDQAVQSRVAATHVALAFLLGVTLALGCSGGSTNNRVAAANNASGGSDSSNPGGGSGTIGGDPNVSAGTDGSGGSSGSGGSTSGGTTDAGATNVNTSERKLVSIDDCGANNPAGLSDQDVQALKAGGAPGSMKYLYPYEGTVFPRGLLAPTLMWDGADGSVVYVHIYASLFDYHGCLPVTGTQQLELPQSVWQTAGDQTTGPGDPFTVELTVKTAGGAMGPIAEKIVIAQATIKGSIFYNSYVSSTSNEGSLYRIQPGNQAQTFLGGNGNGCYACHAVSANGERLVVHPGIDPGSSYALTPTTQPNPPVMSTAPFSGFVGLSPEGSVYAASAHPADSSGLPTLVRPQGTPLESLLINDATLYATDTGTVIANSGLPKGAMMPMFSPDGTRIAFNDYGLSAGFNLSIMDYDESARTFANQQTVYTDSSLYPGWPFFLPDNGAIVFARGENVQFSGGNAGINSTSTALAPNSDLYIVDLASGTTTLLAKAMGVKSPQDQSSYTAFGDADLHKHYYPTVSPVAAGGYFWVFFDTMRNYGNMGVARQLWGSAILISPDGTYAGDPSHPAFFLTGQDFGTGNHRAFTALDPCKKDGESCETGIDCCNGFCTDGICGRPPPDDPLEPPRCSETNEACTTSADCCNPTDICLNGFCGQVILM